MTAVNNERCDRSTSAFSARPDLTMTTMTRNDRSHLWYQPCSV